VPPLFAYNLAMPAMWWILIVITVGGVVFLRLARAGETEWRRNGVPRGDRFHCPHCDIEVSPANPMVENMSGLRIGARTHDRWCQVCERYAEQHVIHRSQSTAGDPPVDS
jgi:hypothetical protein